MMMAHLLASMKDDEGKILIDHFYDGVEPLGRVENEALAEMPPFDNQLRKELWLGRTEGGGRTIAELINLPSLNIRGMASARTEAASNIIPSTATAAIDIRLVKGMHHQQALAHLKAHISKQGYFIVGQPADRQTLIHHAKVLYLKADEFAYDGVRTSMDLPISQEVIRAAARAKTPVLKVPTMGGSLPLIILRDRLNVYTIVTPTVNHDNSQHSFNENIRLQNLWDGIELMAALFTMQ